jgi:hypothetical protein
MEDKKKAESSPSGQVLQRGKLLKPNSSIEEATISF